MLCTLLKQSAEHSDSPRTPRCAVKISDLERGGKRGHLRMGLRGTSASAALMLEALTRLWLRQGLCSPTKPLTRLQCCGLWALVGLGVVDLDDNWPTCKHSPQQPKLYRSLTADAWL